MFLVSQTYSISNRFKNIRRLVMVMKNIVTHLQYRKSCNAMVIFNLKGFVGLHSTLCLTNTFVLISTIPMNFGMCGFKPIKHILVDQQFSTHSLLLPSVYANLQMVVI